MPMFYDPEKCLAQAPKNQILTEKDEDAELRRSEESIRTEFCEGLVAEESKNVTLDAFDVPKLALGRGSEVSDREELMHRIKRGESPTWVPNRKLEALFRQSQNYQYPRENSKECHRSQSPLLPAVQFGTDSIGPRREETEALNALNGPQLDGPVEIERPKSALHSGDFTENRSSGQEFAVPGSSRIEISSLVTESRAIFPPTSWLSSFSKTGPFPQLEPQSAQHQVLPSPSRQPSRDAVSSLQSFSSSFVLKAPTSPLVQQSNQDDSDFSPSDLSSAQSVGVANRRHTYSPQSSQSLKYLSTIRPLSKAKAAHQSTTLQREITLPYQSHQPRRSLTYHWSLQSSSSPHTPPSLRTRRPSVSDASPLQHASMVGSYEESILRGRMSTGPSKPLDFTAQIGALGKGDSKPKFPAHVHVPFPAVYYSWSMGNGRSLSNINDEPSPYVGHIDLEHSLAPVVPKERRRRHKELARSDVRDASVSIDGPRGFTDVAKNIAVRKEEKRKRRPLSPNSKAPAGGSYRIPQEGQLQIMIKNPNKTAVKLFLVPYNLHDMESGTKTFIRQRCYSAGPIIEKPVTSRSGSELSSGARAIIIDPKSKPTLRYLIHLNICCPSKGRYYLYQHIRVVFANRVPDTEEKLQTEIQLPEPRYSVYKPSCDAVASASAIVTRSMADKTARRRSYAFGSNTLRDTPNSLQDPQPFSSTMFRLTDCVPMSPVPSMPFGLIPSRKYPQAPTSAIEHEAMDLDSRPTSPSSIQSPLSDKRARITGVLSDSHHSTSSQGSDGFGKLTRGDAGYGGVFGRPGTPEVGEGLLARRLREFSMEREESF